MLNFYTVRIILSAIIIFAIIYIARKKVVEMTKKKNRIIILIILLFFCLIWEINYENYFINFKNPENIFSYYHPRGKLIKKYEYDDYSYLLYEENHSYNFAYFIKENHSWSSDHFFSISEEHIETHGNCTIVITEKANSAAVAVFHFKKYNDDFEVTDSLSTNFEQIDYKNRNIYVGIIKNSPPENYTLNVGNNKYTIFDF